MFIRIKLHHRVLVSQQQPLGNSGAPGLGPGLCENTS